MLTYSNWMTGTRKTASQRTMRIQHRAADTDHHLYDKEQPQITVVFEKPDGTQTSAELVRLEYDDTVSESESASGQGTRRKLVLYGYRGHATIADTDVKRGYHFVREGREYEVVSIIYQLGEVQAICEIVG